MKIEVCGISENLADLLDIVGEEKFLEIAKLYGGNNVYIPTYRSAMRSSRNREIARRYNGVNSNSLAREYDNIY